jgi:hypothetical protein
MPQSCEILRGRKEIASRPRQPRHASIRDRPHHGGIGAVIRCWQHRIARKFCLLLLGLLAASSLAELPRSGRHPHDAIAIILIAGSALLAQVKLYKPSGLNLFSKEQEVRLGRESAEEVRKTMPMVKNDELVGYVNRIGGRLAKSKHVGGYAFTFEVVNNPSINASRSRADRCSCTLDCWQPSTTNLNWRECWLTRCRTLRCCATEPATLRKGT